MLQWFSKKINNRKGFTLIELVVVIAILGILAGIAVPRYTQSRVAANTAAHNANVRTIESAVSLFQADTGTALADIDDITDLVPNYIKAVPTNPLGTGAYTVTNGEVVLVP